MKNGIITLATVLFLAGSAAAQQPAPTSTGKGRKSTNATRTNAGGAPQMNETAGANTTQEQNAAINTSGAAGGGTMPTTTDARSSTMTGAGPVKAKKESTKENELVVIEAHTHQQAIGCFFLTDV